MSRAKSLILFVVIISARLSAEDIVIALDKEKIIANPKSTVIDWGIAPDGNTMIELSGVPQQLGASVKKISHSPDYAAGRN